MKDMRPTIHHRTQVDDVYEDPAAFSDSYIILPLSQNNKRFPWRCRARARCQVGDVKFGDFKGEDSHGNKYFENKEYPYGEQCGGWRGVGVIIHTICFMYYALRTWGRDGLSRVGVGSGGVSAWLFPTWFVSTLIV